MNSHECDKDVLFRILRGLSQQEWKDADAYRADPVAWLAVQFGIEQGLVKHRHDIKSQCLPDSRAIHWDVAMVGNPSKKKIFGELHKQHSQLGWGDEPTLLVSDVNELMLSEWGRDHLNGRSLGFRNATNASFEVLNFELSGTNASIAQAVVTQFTKPLWALVSAAKDIAIGRNETPDESMEFGGDAAESRTQQQDDEKEGEAEFEEWEEAIISLGRGHNRIALVNAIKKARWGLTHQECLKVSEAFPRDDYERSAVRKQVAAINGVWNKAKCRCWIKGCGIADDRYRLVWRKK